MKKNGFLIAGTGVYRVDLRINVAVGDEKIEPGAVVHVEKSGAPGDVGIARLTDARGPAYVIKALGAHVAIERVGLLFKVGYKEAEASAVVIIAPGDVGIARLTDARGPAYVIKALGAHVAIERVGRQGL